MKHVYYLKTLIDELSEKCVSQIKVLLSKEDSKYKGNCKIFTTEMHHFMWQKR